MFVSPRIRSSKSHLPREAALIEARFNREIGTRLTMARLARGLGLGEFAKLACLSEPVLSRYEHGVGAIPYGRLVRLAGLLEIPLAELIGRDDTEARSSENARMAVQLADIASRMSSAELRKFIALAKAQAASDDPEP